VFESLFPGSTASLNLNIIMQSLANYIFHFGSCVISACSINEVKSYINNFSGLFMKLSVSQTIQHRMLG
jgi:hypothetical protein